MKSYSTPDFLGDLEGDRLDLEVGDARLGDREVVAFLGEVDRLTLGAGARTILDGEVTSKPGELLGGRLK